MEELKLINSQNFEEKVKEYSGKIVSIKYFDYNKGDSVVENVVLGDLNTTHLNVITAYNNELIAKGLARSAVECFYSEKNDELIGNSDYKIDSGFTIKR